MRMMMLPDTGPAIAQFIARLDEIERGVDEETEGWLIRRPTLEENNAALGVLVAESKAGSSQPLTLPEGREICLAVETGAIRIEGFSGEFTAGHFFVVRPKDGRTVRSVFHPTRVTIQYFRGTDNDGSALDLPAVA